MEQKNIKRIFTSIGVMLTIIFLAACSSPFVPAPTQTIETQISQPPASIVQTATEPPVALESAGPNTGQSLCANPYYPVREGATWSYKSAGGPAGEYSFTDTITAVRNDGFTLSTQMSNLTRTQEWDCTPEGLVALQLGGAPVAMLNSQNMQVDLEVKNSSGITFPSQINIGDQWQQNLDFEGKVTALNEEGEATGKAQMNFTALGNESLTVPAGTFDALKIKTDTTINLNVKYNGFPLPVAFTASYTYWFVKDVGWVKASGAGSIAGTSFSETTELQSYKVP